VPYESTLSVQNSVMNNKRNRMTIMHLNLSVLIISKSTSRLDAHNGQGFTVDQVTADIFIQRERVGVC